MQKQKITYEAVGVVEKRHPLAALWIVAAIFAVGAFGYSVWQYGALHEDIYETPRVSPEGPESAYDAALIVAQETARAWQSDAIVASFEPLEGGNERGGASVWRFVFTSTSRTGQGYIVEVKNGEVTTKKEGEVAVKGSALPQNMKTTDEAIAEVQAMPGRENAQIQGVEALSVEGVWYWGVRTDKGTVSIRMEK